MRGGLRVLVQNVHRVADGVRSQITYLTVIKASHPVVIVHPELSVVFDLDLESLFSARVYLIPDGRRI